ncbi:LexA family transcriptional regulator [Hymenobacter sp. HD11105]
MNPAPTPRSTQASRLADLRRQSGLSQREVGEKVGVSNPRISAYEADANLKIKMPVLRKLAQLYKTTVEYIETGKHPATSVPDSSAPPIKSDVSFIHPATLEEYLILPAIPVRARASFVEMAGSGSDYGDLETMRAYNPSSELRKDGSIAIEIDGDSMEPQLRSGMWVAAYPIDPGDFKYVSSGVYVVDYGSSLVIKRIKDNDLLTNGTLTLHSDNAQAGRVVIESNDIRRLWRVVDVIRARVI